MQWIWVFIGGGIGAGLRYGVGRLAHSLSIDQAWAIMAINLLGSLLLGLFAGVILTRLSVEESWRLFIQTGLLGGFTTYATFSLDLVQLGQRQFSLALIYAVASVFGGIALVLVGLKLGRGL